MNNQKERNLKALCPQLPPLKRICSKVLNNQDLYVIHCYDCCKDQTAIYCQSCFLESNHVGHKTKMKRSGGGCCDCGDYQAIKQQGFCKFHSSKIEKFQVAKQVKEAFIAQWKREFQLCKNNFSKHKQLINLMIEEAKKSYLFSELVYQLFMDYDSQLKIPLRKWLNMSLNSKQLAVIVHDLCIYLFQSRDFKKYCCKLFISNFQSFMVVDNINDLSVQLFTCQQILCFTLNTYEKRIKLGEQNFSGWKDFQNLVKYISVIFTCCRFPRCCNTFFQKSYSSFEDIYKANVKEKLGLPNRLYFRVQSLFIQHFVISLGKIYNPERTCRQILNIHQKYQKSQAEYYESISYESIMSQTYIQYRAFMSVLFRLFCCTNEIKEYQIDLKSRLQNMKFYWIQDLIYQSKTYKHPQIIDINYSYENSIAGKIDKAFLQLCPIPQFYNSFQMILQQELQLKFLINLGISLIGLQVDRSNQALIRFQMQVGLQQDKQWWRLVFSNILSTKQSFKMQEVKKLIQSFSYLQRFDEFQSQLWQLINQICTIDFKYNIIRIKCSQIDPDPFLVSSNLTLFNWVQQNLIQRKNYKFYWQQMKIPLLKSYLNNLHFLKLVETRLQQVLQMKNNQYQKMALVLVKMSKLANPEFSQKAYKLAEKLYKKINLNIKECQPKNTSKKEENKMQEKEQCINSQTESRQKQKQKIAAIKKQQKLKLAQSLQKFSPKDQIQDNQNLCGICRQKLNSSKPISQSCFANFTNLSQILLMEKQPNAQPLKFDQVCQSMLQLHSCKHQAHHFCIKNFSNSCFLCRGMKNVQIPSKKWLEQTSDYSLRDFILANTKNKFEQIYTQKLGYVVNKNWLQNYSKSLANLAIQLKKNPGLFLKHKLEDSRLLRDIALYYCNSLKSQERSKTIQQLKSKNKTLYNLAALAAHQMVEPLGLEQFLDLGMKLFPHQKNYHKALAHLFFNQSQLAEEIQLTNIFIKLPYKLIQFKDLFIKRRCNQCYKYGHKKSDELCICLICGMSLCKIYCENMPYHEIGSLNYHSRKYHAGQSVFIGRNSSDIYIVSSPQNTRIKSIYINRFGCAFNQKYKQMLKYFLEYGMLWTLEKSVLQNRLIDLINSHQPKYKPGQF